MNAVMTRPPYLRTTAVLDGEDRRDLEAYFEHLRAFYGIPADRPVFPTRTPSAKKSSAPSGRPAPDRATGRNRGDHPWRNSL